MFKYSKNNVKQLNISRHKMKHMISAGNVQISLVRETNHRKIHTLPTEHGSSWIFVDAHLIKISNSPALQYKEPRTSIILDIAKRLLFSLNIMNIGVACHIPTGFGKMDG